MPTPDRPLPLTDFPGAPSGAVLSPITDDDRPFHDGLAAGRLLIQVCGACGRARILAAPVCPYCLSAEHSWRTASGAGIVHSWVRYHRGYLPEFERLVPYAVVLVELAEGPRMVGRLAGGVAPRIGMPVSAVIERWPAGRRVVAFAEAGSR